MLSTSGEIQYTWSFQPPYAWQDMLPEIRRKSMWTCRHMHQIEWNDGNEPYDHLVSNVKVVLPPEAEARLFTKGIRKAEFLTTILNRPVLELGQLGCPRIGQLKETPFKCQNQDLGMRHRRGCRCATVKCLRFFVWLQANQSRISQDMLFE